MATGKDGLIYVFGGAGPGGARAATEAVSTTYIYDPVARTWTSGAPLPEAREGAQAITLPDGRIAVLGGGSKCSIGPDAGEICAYGSVSARMDVYDPSTGTWNALAPLPTPRYRFAAALYQGRIYALGGTDGHQVLRSVDIYDPTKDTWSRGPDLPQPLLSPGAAADAEDRLDVVGGFNGQQGAARVDYKALLRFDGITWHRDADLPAPAEDRAVTAGASGLVYAIGGFSRQGRYLSTVSIYNTDTHKWEAGGSLPQGLCCGVATTATTGQLLLLGGQGDPTGGPTTQVAAYGSWLAADLTGPFPGGVPALAGLRQREPRGRASVAPKVQVTLTGNSASFKKNAWIYLYLANPKAPLPGAAYSAKAKITTRGFLNTSLSILASQVTSSLTVWVWNSATKQTTKVEIFPQPRVRWMGLPAALAQIDIRKQIAVNVTVKVGYSGNQSVPVPKSVRIAFTQGSAPPQPACAQPAVLKKEKGLWSCTWRVAQAVHGLTQLVAQITAQYGNKVSTPYKITLTKPSNPYKLPVYPQEPGWAIKNDGAQTADGTRTIYGIAGDFNSGTCGTDAFPVCGNGQMSLTGAAQLNAGYIRFGVKMPCLKLDPLQVDQHNEWWDTTRATDKTEGPLNNLLSNAYGHLVPILNLVPHNTSACTLTWSDWKKDAQSLSEWLSKKGYTTSSHYMYLEIGNEPNGDPQGYGMPNNSTNASSYVTIFKETANALDLTFRFHGYSHYRILVAGWTRPTPIDPKTSPSTPCDDFNSTKHVNTLAAARAAIDAAEHHSDAHVADGHLGYAIHPYGFLTSDTARWPGFYKAQKPDLSGHTFAPDSCNKLDQVLAVWLKDQLPVFLTEDNFADYPPMPDAPPPFDAHHYDNQSPEGAYLIDLFSWLAHHGPDSGEVGYGHHYNDPASSQVRVMWFRGQDNHHDATHNLLLGLYTASGDKWRSPLSGCKGKAYTVKQKLSDIFAHLSHGEWLCY